MLRSAGDDEDLYADDDDNNNNNADDADDRQVDDASDNEPDAALLPADGYFGDSSTRQRGPETNTSLIRRGPTFPNAPHVPNIMVEDPTLRQNAAEAKAREASEEASNQNADEEHSNSDHPMVANESNAQQTDADPSPSPTDAVSASHQTSTPSRSPPTSPSLPIQTSPVHQHSHRRSTSTSQRALPSIAHAYSDAPPAYTPSPTTSYGAFGSTASPHSPTVQGATSLGEQTPLLRADPQSMTNPGAEDVAVTQPWIPPVWVTGGRIFGKRIALRLTVFLFALVIAIIVTAGILISPKHHRGGFDDEPIKDPDPPDGSLIHWSPPEYCEKGPENRAVFGQTMDFSADKILTILQLLEEVKTQQRGRPVHVFGDLILRSTNEKVPASYISVESVGNSKGLELSIYSPRVSGSWKLLAPEEIPWTRQLDPCIQLRVTLYMPPDALIGGLDIQTQQLHVRIEKGLSMRVATTTNLLTFVGDVTSPKRPSGQDAAPYRLESPILEVQSLKGRIRGWYPLYNELSLQCSEGTISATFSQKPAIFGDSKPSKLSVGTLVNDIDIRQLDQPVRPNSARRDHQVSISTNTGDVYAETFYSTLASVRSTTGHLNLSVTPASGSDCVLWGYYFCRLNTQTSTGRTHLTVNTPSDDVGGGNDTIPSPWDLQRTSASETFSLRSSHVSQNGDILVRYPSKWEGNIIGSTISGKMNYSGDGLVLKYEDAINKRVRGKKGSGESLMTVYTKTGQQQVIIGGS